MSARELVAQLRSLVESARSMPMSASAVVNRSELLDLVSELESVLPETAVTRQKATDGRDGVLADAHAESVRIVAAARQERERLLEESAVLSHAKEEAERERAAARAEAAELRKDTDAYVDGRLATFEVALTKTLEAVARGRSRLDGRSHFDELGDAAEGDSLPGAGEP